MRVIPYDRVQGRGMTPVETRFPCGSTIPPSGKEKKKKVIGGWMVGYKEYEISFTIPNLSGYSLHARLGLFAYPAGLIDKMTYPRSPSSHRRHRK